MCCLSHSSNGLLVTTPVCLSPLSMGGHTAFTGLISYYALLSFQAYYPRSAPYIVSCLLRLFLLCCLLKNINSQRTTTLHIPNSKCPPLREPLLLTQSYDLFLELRTPKDIQKTDVASSRNAYLQVFLDAMFTCQDAAISDRRGGHGAKRYLAYCQYLNIAQIIMSC